MILEVLADDEAEARGRTGVATVGLDHPGVSVSDDGQRADTRRNADGTVISKAVAATDLVALRGLSDEFSHLVVTFDAD